MYLQTSLKISLRHGTLLYQKTISFVAITYLKSCIKISVAKMRTIFIKNLLNIAHILQFLFLELIKEITKELEKKPLRNAFTFLEALNFSVLDLTDMQIKN